MAHKTKIGGTNYGISGGKTKIGGTNYGISGGKTKVSGTGYDVKFRGAQTSVWITGTVTGGWTSYPVRYDKTTEYAINGGAFIAFPSGTGQYVTTDIHAGDSITIKSTLSYQSYAGTGSGSCRIAYNGTDVVAYNSAAGTTYTFIAGESISIQGYSSAQAGYGIDITNR